MLTLSIMANVQLQVDGTGEPGKYLLTRVWKECVRSCILPGIPMANWKGQRASVKLERWWKAMRVPRICHRWVPMPMGQSLVASSASSCRATK